MDFNLNVRYSMHPEISVLMSCYNAERWLSDAIESILAQTYRNFEFILVDDGSKDDTLSIIRQYEQSDGRIKVIAKPNTGLPDSLNVGISQASGRWIARLDADDTCEPTRLAEQLDLVHIHSDVVLVGTGFAEIDENGRLLKVHSYPSQDQVLRENLRSLKKFFHHSSALYSTEIARELGGYRPRIHLAEDWDLWLRLSTRGKLACLPQPMLRVRKHSNQISLDGSGSGRRQLTDCLLATISYFLRENNCSDPVSLSSNDADWQEFRQWVEEQMDLNGLFRRREAWRIARNRFFEEDSKLLGGWLLLQNLLVSADGLLVIKEKFLGTNLAETLAQAWQTRN
jgi:glycosyltransferase involved in cell wall biosynthesis